MNKFDIKPPTFERSVRRLLNLELIQKLDSKYKEHWIRENRFLLGKSYRTLIDSFYHRSRLKVYILTEKGEEVVSKLEKIGFVGTLYNKVKKVNEKLKEEANKILEERRKYLEEERKRKEELRKKLEEQQKKEFKEKLQKAIELIKSLEIKESNSELIETCYELVKLEGNKSAIIEENNKVIEIKKTEVKQELAEKILVNFYELAQENNKLTAIRKEDFIFVNKRTIALVFDKEFRLLPVIFKFYIKPKEVMHNG